VSGQLTILSQVVGEDEIHSHILKTNDIMTHEPNIIHALIADEDTVFLAMADGVRGGDDYENDTFRIEVPLQDLYTGGVN
jgi:hypothetical protein